MDTFYDMEQKHDDGQHNYDSQENRGMTIIESGILLS